MQHHIISQGGELTRLPGGVSTLGPPQPPRELSLVGFRDAMAFSFFFHTHRWAFFWRPILRWIPDGSNDPIYKASLAVSLGYMAREKGNPILQQQATELCSGAVNTVQNTLAKGSKSDSARMTRVVAALGIYNVRYICILAMYKFYSHDD
jgi:hypothetical protein